MAMKNKINVYTGKKEAGGGAKGCVAVWCDAYPRLNAWLLQGLKALVTGRYSVQATMTHHYDSSL